MAKKTFELKFDTVDIEIRNPDTGKSEEFVLRSFDGHARDAYLDDLNTRIEGSIGDGSQPRIRSLKDLRANLISQCLFRKQNNELIPVTVEEIQKWPDQLIEDLNSECVSLCKLNKEALEESKKDSHQKSDSGTDSPKS